MNSLLVEKRIRSSEDYLYLTDPIFHHEALVSIIQYYVQLTNTRANQNFASTHEENTLANTSELNSYSDHLLVDYSLQLSHVYINIQYLVFNNRQLPNVFTSLTLLAHVTSTNHRIALPTFPPPTKTNRDNMIVDT